ncbi:excalibur calcium-binding domain-containing protein [Deinococcus sp. A31D244]|uniref:excalibur calcium-binding domain-containing protein n=1 Tax=Deinococcus sp. A31D244 TaxID=3397675 RepID=UPI0039E02989
MTALPSRRKRSARETCRRVPSTRPPEPHEPRDAGSAPLWRGQPDYSSNLDRDGDGIGCE